MRPWTPSSPSSRQESKESRGRRGREKTLATRCIFGDPPSLGPARTWLVRLDSQGCHLARAPALPMISVTARNPRSLHAAAYLTVVEAREQVEVEVELGRVKCGRVRGAGRHQVHHLGNEKVSRMATTMRRESCKESNWQTKKP